MKKGFKLLTLLVICTGLFAVGSTVVQQQEQQKFSVELTLQEWELVLQVIDASSAPHVQVKQVQSVLVTTLQEQISKYQESIESKVPSEEKK